jgi:hypothetical protein
MRASRCLALGLALLGLISINGCANMKKNRVALAEPGLSIGDDGQAMAAPAPVKQNNFAARHPIINRPGKVYENTNSGPVVKTLAAGVVGVPWGLFEEGRQIVVGTDPSTR